MTDTIGRKSETAWHNEQLPAYMMNTHFPHIKNSDHFPAIKQCFSHIGEAKNLIDLGCGKAEISDVFTEYEYCGADLPHMIQKVSRLSKPTLKYVEFDVYLSDMNFISEFDIVLMNSFLSEIPNANQILDKVLKHSKRHVVIHRQIIENQENIVTYSTYGSLPTIAYTFDRKEFEDIVHQNSFKKLVDINTFPSVPNTKTILLQRM